MTFHELAENILKDSDKPLTANEIWQLAVEKGLDHKLNSQGVTPWATLGSRLYVISRDNPDSIFKSIGKRPKRFYLNNKMYNIDFKEYEEGKTEEETYITSTQPTKIYSEKDLHPYLAHFSFYNLNCHTKTINHSKSDKKSFGEWVHPDIVGCVFPIDEWDNEVLELSSAVGNTSIKFISFELKKVHSSLDGYPADSVRKPSSSIDTLPTKSGSLRHRSTPCRQSQEAFVIDRHPADSVRKLSSSIDASPTKSGSFRR